MTLTLIGIALDVFLRYPMRHYPRTIPICLAPLLDFSARAAGALWIAVALVERFEVRRRGPAVLDVGRIGYHRQLGSAV